MKVYQFTEQPYPDAWKDHQGSLRVNLPNRKCDPKVAADLFHRYYDEWMLADELGYDIMLNEHHQTATCMSSTVVVGLSVLSRITNNARLLVLGYPIGHRPDPLRVAEELSTIDVISRGRLDMGFIKGVPYEFPASNQNPVGVMERFWESHDFIIKAMTSHDAPFNWESKHFHYRHVNIWPRPWQQPHPPVWSTTGSKSNARVLGERGYVMATLGTGYNTRALYDVYREGYMSKGRAGGELPALGRHRLPAVPQSAGLSLGRGPGAAPARRDPAAQLHQGPPRHRHAQRQRAGADRRRHPVLRHARPGLRPDRRLLRILRRNGQPADDGPRRRDDARRHGRQPHLVR